MWELCGAVGALFLVGLALTMLFGLAMNVKGFVEDLSNYPRAKELASRIRMLEGDRHELMSQLAEAQSELDDLRAHAPYRGRVAVDVGSPLQFRAAPGSLELGECEGCAAEHTSSAKT